MSTGTGIGGLVGQSSWRRLTLSSFLARLPISMSLFGIVLAGQAVTGSLATGAKLSGVTTFSAGLLGPLRGRLMDKGELRGRLQRGSFGASGLLVLFAVAVAVKAHVVVLYAICVGFGYAMSGVWGGFRALLVVAVSPGHLRRSHFVESLMVEACYGVGPLLVTVLAVVGGAVAVLLGMAAAAFAAGVSLFGVVRLHPQPIPRTHLLRRRTDIRVLVALAFCLGLGFGTFDTNVPQRMPQYGLNPAVAGVFLLILSVGSVLGGLYVSLRPIDRRNTARKASIMLFVFAALMMPSVLAPSAVSYGASLLFASLMLVPLNGLETSELEARIGQTQRAEAFSLVLATTMVGAGLGGVLNGILVAPLGAWRVPYLSVALFLLLGVTLALVSLRPQGSRPYLEARSASESSEQATLDAAQS